MEHRYVASGIEMPVGVKNTTGGDIGIGVNGVLSVQSKHTFAFHNHQVSTTGNPHAHLILRGGGGRPNYDPQSIALAQKLMHEKKIANPAIVVDASHDNSMNGHGKDPALQTLVVRSILDGIRMRREEYACVRGVMVESFLKHGKQPEKGPDYDLGGLSITDPCQGWEDSERLVRETAASLPS